MLKKLVSGFKGKNKIKSLLISIVILIEIFALFTVGAFAWVETVSSLKIADNGKGRVDSYVYTDATIGLGDTIDLADYFKKAGDMHLAPASSADGKSFFFPQKAVGNAFINTYRKGCSSDRNTTYMSITFRLKTAENNNADFFFTQDPTFSNHSSQIRVSVTAYSEGTTPKPEDTKIYGKAAGTDTVVSGVGNATTADTGSVTRKSIASSIKGTGHNNCIFSVGAEETKIVTINLWLQNTSTDMSAVMASTVSISNFGITSSLTPRKVSLVPGSVWSKDNPTYYAWCWAASNGAPDKLYKMTDNHDGSYGFEYPGNYTNMVFVRAKTNCSYDTGANVKNDSTFWNNNVLNQTIDTIVPDSPVDPTFFITDITGGKRPKENVYDRSKGVWEEPGIVKVAFVTGHSGSGTLSAVYNDTINTQITNDPWSGSTYPGYTATYQSDLSAVKILSFASDTAQATPTPVSTVTIKATAASGYAFEGWYTDPEGNTAATPTNASDTVTAPAKGMEMTYYAKFKEVRRITLSRYVERPSNNDYVSASTNTGVMYIGDDSHHSTGAVSTYYRDVDKDSTVEIYATANPGYSVEGIYTTGSAVASEDTRTDGGVTYYSITASQNATYHVRYNLVPYNVTACAASASYSSSTYSANANGGKVKVSTASGNAGASSSGSVKYTQNVTLTATAATGYEFIGWYDALNNGNLKSSNASYTYNLSTTGNKTFYARFKAMGSTTIYVAPRENWGDDYYVRLYQGSGTNVVDSNNGFVKAEYDGSTGYYKATFTSSKTGSFYALIAKDTNHTDKVPSSGGYSGNLGTNYIFKHDQSASALTQYSSQRCIWFIIGSNVQWIKTNMNDWGDWLNIYANSQDNAMRRINDNAYVVEFSSVSGTIYFQQHYSGNGYRNQWTASIQSDKSQYTASSYNSGSWTN